MREIDSLREQIEKTKILLAESEHNFQQNPNDFSARLLLMSTENHLADLLTKMANYSAAPPSTDDQAT